MLNWISRLIGSLSPVRSSLGIEITDRSIKLIELEWRGRSQPVIAKYLAEPLPAQTIEEGQIVDLSAVIIAVQSMLDKLRIRSKRVQLAIPSHQVMLRFLKFPNLPDADLRKVLDFELKHSIHLPFDDPYYDYVRLTPYNGVKKAQETPTANAKAALEPSNSDWMLSRKYRKRGARRPARVNKRELQIEESAVATESNAPGRGSLFGEFESSGPMSDMPPADSCEVLLVAAPGELVEDYADVMLSAGLEPSVVEIKAFSMFRVVEFARLTDKGSTFLLVDVNENVSDLSIFRNGQLKITRSVPLNFAGTSISGPEPEPTALFAEFADPDEEFRNACGDLAHELERLMNFYRYTLNNRNEAFDCIVLSGDISRLKEAASFLSDRLSLAVPLLTTDDIRPANIATFLHEFPSFSVPIGLALRGPSA